MAVYLSKAHFIDSKKPKKLVLSVDTAKGLPCPHMNFLSPAFFFSSEVITVALWLNTAGTARVPLSALLGLLQRNQAAPVVDQRPPNVIAQWVLHRPFMWSPPNIPLINLPCNELWDRPKSKKPIYGFTEKTWGGPSESGHGFKSGIAGGQIHPGSGLTWFFTCSMTVRQRIKLLWPSSPHFRKTAFF